jgi:hypothetical protein
VHKPLLISRWLPGKIILGANFKKILVGKTKVTLDKNLLINISNSKQVAVTINNKCLYLLDPTGKAPLKIILVPMLKSKFLISDRVNLIYLRTKF